MKYSSQWIIQIFEQLHIPKDCKFENTYFSFVDAQHILQCVSPQQCRFKIFFNLSYIDRIGSSLVTVIIVNIFNWYK